MRFDNQLMAPVALALLPPEIEVGSKIKCEYFQYEIIG